MSYSSVGAELIECVFFVEATAFDMESLRIACAERPDPVWTELLEPIEWVSDPRGVWKAIKSGTTITFRFAYINGSKICFYDPTSAEVGRLFLKTFIEQRGNWQGICRTNSFIKCLTKVVGKKKK